MKYFSIILFVLLFLFAGKTQAMENTEFTGNINLKLFAANCLPSQSVGLEDGILDVQDTNEMDGFEGCIIHPETATDPLQNSVSIKTEVTSVKLQIQINSFFIDLPPPLLS